MKHFPSFILLLLLCSFTTSHKEIGDLNVSVFKDTHLYFDMALKTDKPQMKEGFYRLDAGRVLLKKLQLPVYKKQAQVTAEISLKSKGDPWDKSGSFFVVPKDSKINILDLESGNFDKTMLKDAFPAIKPFGNGETYYEPNVELLRFLTPFGVGFFNDHERTKTIKPVYIPKWEEQVEWKQDITHLLSLLEGEVWVGVYIDTWSKEGYELSVDLHFDESTIPRHKKKKEQVIPIMNNTKYASIQDAYDEFSRSDLSVNIQLKKPLKNVRFYYLTTGHGGHSTGDEFVKKENIISMNGKIIKQFIPWRDDCASFRRFNPSAGVRAKKTMWKENEIEERIASSDYSRSNWCPGSDVTPEIINLGDLKAGTHTFTFSIPEAQEEEKDKHNFWNVSAYLVGE